MKKLILCVALSVFALSVVADDAATKGACPAGQDKSCCPATKKADTAACSKDTAACAKDGAACAKDKDKDKAACCDKDKAACAKDKATCDKAKAGECCKDKQPTAAKAKDTAKK